MTNPPTHMACAGCGQRYPEVSKAFPFCMDCEQEIEDDDNLDDVLNENEEQDYDEDDFDDDYFDAKING